MHGPGATVIKLGGSFAFSADLGEWIAAIAGCAGRAVIVPGGGPFADAVRAAQAQMGFDDRGVRASSGVPRANVGRGASGAGKGGRPARWGSAWGRFGGPQSR